MTAASDSVNVKVAVRARPLNGREKNLNCSECVKMEGKTTTLTDVETGKTKQFSFDYCYWHDTTQQTVYSDLAKPIVEAAIDGFNGVIFAYGQTGSGKTHSMMGSGDDIGIVPLMNRELFELLAAKKEMDNGEFLVTASYMEIYNEVIHDLLNPSEKQLKIREHPKFGIYVEHLAELVVETAQDIANLLDQGNNVKQVAATQMNERSSRSHCCFVINIQQRKTEEIGTGDEAMKRETTLSAKINLVDLAGSERASKTGAEGSRLKEGAAINQSLSVLGQVINMLAEGGKGHIPYRDSKLTRVLQQALGGNARTVMIAAISPADNNYQETLSTLQYASRAKKIQNTSVRNEDVNQRMIRELKEEVERLRAQMAAIERGEQVGVDPSSSEEMVKMQETIAILEEAKQRQWDEVQKLSKMYEEERARTLANETVVRSIMQNVKEEKATLLKQLHMLEQEKSVLAKSLKQAKASYQQKKTDLEQDMETYKKLLEVPKDQGRDDKQIKKVYARIEFSRDEVVNLRNEMKEIKDKARLNQEKQIELKAEIEAQKHVLLEDAAIRQAIQEEERSKLKSELKTRSGRDLLESMDPSALQTGNDKLKEQINEIEGKFKKRMDLAEKRQEELMGEIHELKLEIIDHKCDKQLYKREIARLKAKLEIQEANHQMKLQDMESNYKALIGNLVHASKYDQFRLVQALKQASADYVQLYKQYNV